MRIRNILRSASFFFDGWGNYTTFSFLVLLRKISAK